MSPFSPPTNAWESVRTESGETLGALSDKAPVLIVFLRHCGCTFARETLNDIAARREAIQQAGTTIVLVHMQTEAEAKSLFARYVLDNVHRISDPQQELYRAFEIARGSLWQVAGPQMWWRAITAVARGNMFGVPNADVFQLPGAFLVYQGKIVNSFRAKSSADRPDYLQLTRCEVS